MMFNRFKCIQFKNIYRRRCVLKTTRRLILIILTIIFCLCIQAVALVFAATTTQDELEVTLSTDKKEYDKTEEIVATLSVKNTGNSVASNIVLENEIPDGYVLSDDSELLKNVASLERDETVIHRVSFVPNSKEGDTDTGDNSGNDDKTGDSEKKDDNGKNNNSNMNDDSGVTKTDVQGNKSNSSNNKTGSSKSTATIANSGSNTANNTSSNKTNNSSTQGSTSSNHPSTGDKSNIMIWVILVLVCGVIIILILKNKKRGKEFLSLFVCMTLLESSLIGFSTSVDAADAQQKKTISVSESIIVEETELEISAKVKYELDVDDEEDQPDVGEISFREPSKDHCVLDEDTGDYFVDNEILITGKENTTREEIEHIISEFKGIIVGYIAITNDYQVEISNNKTVSELNEIVEQLNVDDAIDEAMIHWLYEVTFDATPNDTKWNSEEWSSDYPEGKNWGVEAINAMSAWDHYNEMSYVKVGIIDSMFDTNHEDLVYTKVWNNPQSTSSESGIEDFMERSHGTHVSGTIAAGYNNGKGIAGVAPKVKLYGYSILGNATDSIATDSNKAFAGLMEWKYALANLITSNCKVINVSMGVPGGADAHDLIQYSHVLGTFFEKLIENGYDFVIVQSAGNDSIEARNNGIFTGIDTPDMVRNRIIIVGAMGNNGSHKNGLFGWFGDRVFDGYYYASFSNYGQRVDIVAPGVDIYSTVLGNSYENIHKYSIFKEGQWDGTSMATPHVTGTVAMCFAVNPSLTGAQVKNIIVNSSTSTVTDNNANHNDLRTYPVLNAGAAVESALNTHGEAVSPVNPSTGIVLGSVRGYDDNHQVVELEDVKISAYRISDYDGNLSEYASATRSDSCGNYELVLEAGKYYINIYKEGYFPFAICDVTSTNDQITYLDNVILYPDSGTVEISNRIHGTVRNALTGSAIEGVTVQLRPGWNNKNGTLATVIETGADAVSITDNSGKYSLEVLEGCYTAEFIKDGYITGYVNVICASMENADQGAVLTPILSDDEYRIVLTWSSTPSDLDSHVSGPLSTGGRFHVYYSDMHASDNGEKIANLDLDDTTSFGPETITLMRTQEGIYKYAVHDYTNRNSTSSKALSMSGAKVQLYCGNALIATYNVPINVTGTVWNVFEIVDGTVRMINTMENNSQPSTVCGIGDRNDVTSLASTDNEENVGKYYEGEAIGKNTDIDDIEDIGLSDDSQEDSVIADVVGSDDAVSEENSITESLSESNEGAESIEIAKEVGDIGDASEESVIVDD